MKRIVMALILGGLALQMQAQTMFTVEKKGKGSPMVLIHGLYCSGEVWQETVKHYQNSYECHIITLAGFAGNTPNLQEPFLESVVDDISKYIVENKLHKPVVVGHSMGAFLSIWLASKNPDLVAGVIAVDGLPFLAAVQMPNATAESAKPMATNMKSMMGNLSPEQTKMNQQMYLPSMIRDKDKIDLVAEMAMKSDPKTIGQVMYEMYTIDLRETAAAIKCPVLVLGAWVGYKDYGATREGSLRSYESQFAKVKNCKVLMSDTAKHFIFYDEPAWFFESTDTFLKSL